MMDSLRFGLTALFLLVGLIVMSVSVLGQFRFQTALNRIHAASMCDTLGLFSLLVGLSISTNDGWMILKFALTMMFLWIASPTASHLIARLEAATNSNLPQELEVLTK